MHSWKLFHLFCILLIYWIGCMFLLASELGSKNVKLSVRFMCDIICLFWLSFTNSNLKRLAWLLMKFQLLEQMLCYGGNVVSAAEWERCLCSLCDSSFNGKLTLNYCCVCVCVVCANVRLLSAAVWQVRTAGADILHLQSSLFGRVGSLRVHTHTEKQYTDKCLNMSLWHKDNIKKHSTTFFSRTWTTLLRLKWEIVPELVLKCYT